MYNADDVESLKTYASEPVLPRYVQPPTDDRIKTGVSPFNNLPAQYWNYYVQQLTRLSQATKNITAELNNALKALDAQAELLPQRTDQLGTKLAMLDGRLRSLESMTDVYTPSHINTGYDRYLIFDFSDANHRSLKIRSDTRILVQDSEDEIWWDSGKNGQTFDFDQMITDVSNAQPVLEDRNADGKDWYVYLYYVDGEHGVVVSRNSTYPNDVDAKYNQNNTRKIGWFHTICKDVEDRTMLVPIELNSVTPGDTIEVKHYVNAEDEEFHQFYSKSVLEIVNSPADEPNAYGTAKVNHPLKGFLSGQILPESVWGLTFRPYAEPEGMCYDVDTDLAVDIYLQSGRGKNTRSAYGANTTRSRSQINHQDDMRQVRKRLLYDQEFYSIAIGSNEKTNIQNSAEASIRTAGGHKDTQGQRMISAIGCEDCCGAIWQWLSDVAATGGAGFTNLDGYGYMGQTYGNVQGLYAGGDWIDSSGCGSRARDAKNAVSAVAASLGGRGASRVRRYA